MEEYIFEKGLFRLFDKELELDHNEQYTPILLPKNPENHLKLTETHEVASFEYSDGTQENEIISGGIRDGQYLLSYPNGNTKLQCYYKAGKLHGPSKFYGEEGQLLVSSWYIKGLQQGKAHSFYVSGNPCGLQRFLNGVWHGLQEYWYENGAVKTLMEYSKGELNGCVKLFYPSGTLKRQLLFKQGRFVDDSQALLGEAGNNDRQDRKRQD